MFSKNLAIILAISCLSAVPAFAQVHDVDVDKDPTHAVDKDKDQKGAVTRTSETSADRADAIRSARDGKSSDLSKSALDAISAHIRTAQTNIAKGGDVATEILNAHIGIHNIITNSPADVNGEKALASINHENFEEYLQELKALHSSVMDPILDKMQGQTKANAEQMVRSFRHLLMGAKGRVYHARPSELAEAIQTYATGDGRASINWSHIEEDAGKLMEQDTSLSFPAAKLKATENFIRSKHPEMSEDMVKKIAEDINKPDKGCV